MKQELSLVIREPNKAYVDAMLWLPKAHINETAIKNSLEFQEMVGNQFVMRRLWEETPTHIICPREFLRPSQYRDFQFPFVDLTPRFFSKTGLAIKSKPRDEDQLRAAKAFALARSGILNLACGKGKTFLSLKKIVELGCPALVVVHNGFVMNQWVTEAIPTHLELPPGETIGVIQGGTFDWKHPITVAMIHTLAARAEEGRLPAEFRNWFGAIVFDEVHHLSAPLFVTTAPLIKGFRFGLTATERRVDGTDFIFKFHIGEVFHSDLVQKLIPRVYFQRTPIFFDITKTVEIRDITGELNIPKLRSYMGELDESNNFRAACIREAANEGRKILCVSHSKNQLRCLHEMFSGSGLIISETNLEERSAIVKRSQVTFAIAALGLESLDDNQLDTIFVLLPFGSRNSPPNDLQQVMGRIQRERPGRNAPVMVIFDDYRIKPLHSTCNTMRNQLRHWDKHVRGMPVIDHQTLAVP